MHDDEIKIVSTSNKTADMTPIIILDETTRTQVCFELQQIDNEKEPEKKLKGKFIYTVANKSTGTFDDIKKHCGQSISGQGLLLHHTEQPRTSQWFSLSVGRPGQLYHRS